MSKNRWIRLTLGWMGLLGCCVSAQDKPVLFVGKSPDEIYQIIHQAKWNLDVDTVLACTSQRASGTSEQVYNQLMLERSTRPQGVKILRVEVQNRLATLQVAGRRQDRETGKMFTSQGTVTLVQEEGTWRMRHEEWSPEVFEPAPPPERPAF